MEDSFEREIVRVKGNRFCAVKIEVGDGRLSITGEAGEASRAHSGMDIRKVNGSPFLVTSWGQIVDDMSDFFPEVRPLLPWHLNDMRAGCEHQRELGWHKETPQPISRPCPVCNYKYGSEWKKECLTREVIELARTVCKADESK